MTTTYLFLQFGSSGLINLAPILLIFAVFYFLVIVPQKKRQRQLQETVSQLKIGDRIFTTGGIIGTVTQVKETSLMIRSAEKSIIEVLRSSVGGLSSEEEQK
jgi:preprotein translocase subunit YajC